MKCNKTSGKWCENKHEASKIIDTLETYQVTAMPAGLTETSNVSVIAKYEHSKYVLAMK
jgi:hypothetical protein